MGAHMFVMNDIHKRLDGLYPLSDETTSSVIHTLFVYRIVLKHELYVFMVKVFLNYPEHYDNHRLRSCKHLWYDANSTRILLNKTHRWGGP